MIVFETPNLSEQRFPSLSLSLSLSLVRTLSHTHTHTLVERRVIKAGFRITINLSNHRGGRNVIRGPVDHARSRKKLVSR